MFIERQDVYTYLWSTSYARSVRLTKDVTVTDGLREVTRSLDIKT